MIVRILLVSIMAFSGLSSSEARANTIEVSAGFSFNRTNYSPGNFSWTRRLGGSLAYKFSALSSIEVAVQDVYDRTKIENFEDTYFRDKIYSVNWVQNLFTFASIQPYFKVGAGQLNREAGGQYANGASPNPRTDSVTAVIGAGTRIYVTRGFGIRIEAMSYLTGGAISTYRDNVGLTIGASVGF
jgi:hypothetical protein